MCLKTEHLPQNTALSATLQEKKKGRRWHTARKETPLDMSPLYLLQHKVSSLFTQHAAHSFLHDAMTKSAPSLYAVGFNSVFIHLYA